MVGATRERALGLERPAGAVAFTSQETLIASEPSILPGLHLSRDTDGSTTIVTAVGELDIASSPRFGVELSDAIRSGASLLVIDLSGVDFLDSTGLAMLLNGRRQALRRGITLRLVCNEPSTLRLLALTRLASDFDVYPSLEQAGQPVTVKADRAPSFEVKPKARPPLS